MSLDPIDAKARVHSEAGDRVVVKAVDSAVDKLVSALLKGIADEAGQDEEATEPA